MARLIWQSQRNVIAGAVVLAIVGLSFGRAFVAAADDPKPPAAADAEIPNAKGKRPLKVSEIPASMLTVPAKADAKELLRFIHRINALRPEFESEAQAEKFLTTSRNAVLAATDKLLKSNPTEPQRVEALKAKLGAYQDLLIVGVPDILPQELKFAKQLKNDKVPALSEMGDAAWIDFKMSTIPASDAKGRKEIVEIVASKLRAKPREYLEFATQLGRMLESLGDGQTAAYAYETFGGILASNLNEQIREMGESLRTGAVRRARLLEGAPLQISGASLEGKPFDIKEYKGKVVVVDFWATWCGPCVEELANLKAVYEKYHKQGLEVVGVNLDDEKPAVTKFLDDNPLPWKILFSADAHKKGFANPNAERYGITAIPVILLMNRDGKVISLAARGERLATLVEKLIGGGSEAAGN